MTHWLTKRGRAVRALKADLWDFDKSSPSWSGGAAGLLALTPNLRSLHIHDDCGFFQKDSALACLSHLTGLRRLNLTLDSLTMSFMRPAASDPLRHLTALESLTLCLAICGPSFQVSEHLTALCQLTFLSLEGAHDGLDDGAIALTVPMLPSLKHLVLGGYLDKGPATLKQFSQLQSLSVQGFFPDAGSFRSPSPGHFPYLSRLILQVPEHMILLDWICLLESLLKLPALQVLDVECPTLRKMLANVWACHPDLDDVDTEHAHIASCPDKIRPLSHVMCLILACTHRYELPKGPSLQAQIIFDLSHALDISTLHNNAALL